MDAEHFALLHADPATAELHRLPVPAKPTFLRHWPRRKPRLTVRRPGRAAIAAAVVLEPIVVNGKRHLLMLRGAAAALHCNGRPAQPVTLLRERDEIRLGDDTFFVTSVPQPTVGPPTAVEVGTTCPICLVQIAEDSRIYRCHNCAVTIHHEDENWGEEHRLECAELVSECPNCRKDIEFELQPSWSPEC